MRLRGDGPFYVAQRWGRTPDGLVSKTSSERLARTSLRKFAREQRESQAWAASGYRLLRCDDRTALERADRADYGATPEGCTHFALED